MQSPHCPQPQPHADGFSGLLEVTSAILTSAKRLDLESSNGWTPQTTRSLSAFSDRLVASLLPNLAAMESVFGPYLDADLKDALKADHQQMRRFAERMAMVTEAISRSRRPKSEVALARVVLRALLEASQELKVHQIAAVIRLVATLPDSVGEIAESFDRALREARERIVLITQPEVPATEAYVLRRRPDLDGAYATTLAAVDQGRVPQTLSRVGVVARCRPEDPSPSRLRERTVTPAEPRST